MDPQYTTNPIYDAVTVGRVAPQLNVPPTPGLPYRLPTPFITPDELKTHIYTEVVTAITDSDDTILPMAIDAATQEMMGYLSRFDYVTILSQTGTARDPILVLYLKDISVWHLIVLANPNVEYELRSDRYKSAIRWLEKVQDGRFNPAGWPPAPTSNISTEFHVRSLPKRRNDY